MITDAERREVARKLREIELMRLPDSDSEMEAIHEAVGCWFGQPHFDQEVTDRLADLIDPGESGQNRDRNQDTVQMESPDVQIAPEFDRDALLALAERERG